MSVKLMSVVWDMDLQPTKKFVLLALADCANDVGTGCFPSVPTIAKKCSLSIRIVRKCIGELSQEGHISINERSGRSSTYSIHPGTSCRGAPGAGVHLVPTPPAPDAGVPRHVVPGTPARRAPITIIEPSVEPSRNRKRPATARKAAPHKTTIPDGFSLDTSLAAYALEHLPGVNPSELFESFKSKALAKGWTYCDWRRALQEFIRNCAPNSGHWASGQYPKSNGAHRPIRNAPA
jgi:hypothetical protein